MLTYGNFYVTNNDIVIHSVKLVRDRFSKTISSTKKIFNLPVAICTKNSDCNMNPYKIGDKLYYKYKTQ